MSYRLNATFQGALEIIEKFPEPQREDLINIVRQCIIEQRREHLAKSVEESRAEYSKGEIKKGTFYFRPTEVDLLIGDSSKAKEKFGWNPKVKFEKLVKIMAQADLEKVKKRGY